MREDSIAALRDRARRRLPRAVFDFIDGGAELEGTLRRNTADFDRISLVPNCLVDVDRRDCSAILLGRKADLPLVVGPTGLAALVWPKADLALARAAAAAGVPFVVSTSSSMRLEEIAAASPGSRLWMQIYAYRDRELVKSLIRRARSAGFEALVVTVDTPVLGHRSRDHANRFSVPLRPTARLAADLLRCPRWTWGILRWGVPRMQNFVEAGKSDRIESLARLMTRNLNPGATWDDLMWIREAWHGKLLLKGVLSAGAAERAVREGVEGLVVSNHGGRQLDGAPSSISMLGEIVAAVGNRIETYLDGGIRRGMDLAKAMAIGARAGMVGRATLYGVAAGGELGAYHALQLLRTEFDRALALLGCAHATDLVSGMIREQR